MTLMFLQAKRQTFSRVEGRERKYERSVSRFLFERCSEIERGRISSSRSSAMIWPLFPSRSETRVSEAYAEVAKGERER